MKSCRTALLCLLMLALPATSWAGPPCGLSPAAESERMDEAHVHHHDTDHHSVDPGSGECECCADCAALCGAGGGATTCAHSECSVGDPLTQACSSCAYSVCDADPF